MRMVPPTADKKAVKIIDGVRYTVGEAIVKKCYSEYLW